MYISFISKHTCCWHTAGFFRCLIVLFAILPCFILLYNCKSLHAGQVVCEQKLRLTAQCPACGLLFFFSNSWLSSLTTGSSFLPKNPLVAFNGEGSCCCPQVTTCTWEWVMLPGALNTHSNNSFTSPRGAGLVLDLFLSFFLAFLLIF